MLDVEPPPGLRGRVLDRIEAAGSGRRRWRTALWLAAPIAAAAVILLAVLGPWRQAIVPAPPAPTVVANATDPLALTPVAPPPAPAATHIAPPHSTPPRPAGAAPLRSGAPPAPGRGRNETGVAAAAAAADADVVWVDPLTPPSALAVTEIETAGVRAINSIDLAPAEIPALAVRPISDLPRERRNQE
jgi:hypothetical protein